MLGVRRRRSHDAKQIYMRRTESDLFALYGGDYAEVVHANEAISEWTQCSRSACTLCASKGVRNEGSGNKTARVNNWSFCQTI